MKKRVYSNGHSFIVKSVSPLQVIAVSSGYFLRSMMLWSFLLYRYEMSTSVSKVHPWDNRTSCLPTLFAECLAHENHPNFMKLLGHWPWPRVILILSNRLEIKWRKTPNGRYQVHYLPRFAVDKNQHGPEVRVSDARSLGGKFGEIIWRRV